MNTPLPGCSPVPLAHYLKALGVLRLVSEQGTTQNSTPPPVAFWSANHFVLSSSMGQDALVEFFLQNYEPSPVIAPWNGGSGFYAKDNQESLLAISTSRSERLQSYRKSIETALGILQHRGLSQKPAPEAKSALLQECRNLLSDKALEWMDAVFVLGHDGPKYPPLLGTGGNDGRLEFTNNFMQRLVEVMDPVSGKPTKPAESWLRAALFGKPSVQSTVKAPVGQFFPGSAGGANGTAGFDAPSAVNPWDFILMIEGALLFATASVKHLETSGAGALVYPFCVNQAAVGYASAASTDEEARCEMWMPLWDRPVALPELRMILGEGRAQVGGRPARNGVDFARAAVTLGVERGLTSFQRYGFQVRNGLAYFATPLDRVPVRRNFRANLLADIDQWLDRLRLKAGPRANPAAPASVSRALHHVERCILDLCRDDSPDRLQALLAALGGAERSLARSLKWTKGEKVSLRPLRGLSPDWLAEADTQSVEFRLAASLAGMRSQLDGETFWFRQNLEPLEMGTNQDGTWVRWAEIPGNDVSWHEGNLIESFNSTLSRRIVRVVQSGTRGWPDWSPKVASLEDITNFIEGRIDDTLLADLIWALSLVDWEIFARDTRSLRHSQAEDSSLENMRETRTPPSSLYALLRLCFRRATREDLPIPLVPAIHRRAAQGQGTAASELAARRLLGSGQAPLARRIPVEGELARRTAAALLFPISRSDFRFLESTILLQLQTTTL
jgi:CRISPR-associated protein Csx17